MVQLMKLRMFKKKKACRSVGGKIWAGKKTPLREYIYL